MNDRPAVFSPFPTPEELADRVTRDDTDLREQAHRQILVAMDKSPNAAGDRCAWFPEVPDELWNELVAELRAKHWDAARVTDSTRRETNVYLRPIPQHRR